MWVPGDKGNKRIHQNSAMECFIIALQSTDVEYRRYFGIKDNRTIKEILN